MENKENNLQNLIKFYEQKLSELEPNSEQYAFYNNELSRLKQTQAEFEADIISQMIALYKVELSRMNETNPKYLFYTIEIERLENILLQNSESLKDSQTR